MTTFHNSRHLWVFFPISGKEEVRDPTGQASYLEACEILRVVPASYFLRHLRDSELSMMHRGLGPLVL